MIRLFKLIFVCMLLSCNNRKKTGFYRYFNIFKLSVSDEFDPDSTKYHYALTRTDSLITVKQFYPPAQKWFTYNFKKMDNIWYTIEHFSRSKVRSPENLTILYFLRNDTLFVNTYSNYIGCLDTDILKPFDITSKVSVKSEFYLPNKKGESVSDKNDSIHNKFQYIGTINTLSIRYDSSSSAFYTPSESTAISYLFWHSSKNIKPCF